MKSIRIRISIDMSISTKDGWMFEYNDDGELVLCASELALAQYVDRDEIIAEILRQAENGTRADDALRWYVTSVSPIRNEPL